MIATFHSFVMVISPGLLFYSFYSSSLSLFKSSNNNVPILWDRLKGIQSVYSTFCILRCLICWYGSWCANLPIWEYSIWSVGFSSGLLLLIWLCLCKSLNFKVWILLRKKAKLRFELLYVPCTHSHIASHVNIANTKKRFSQFASIFFFTCKNITRVLSKPVWFPKVNCTNY